MYGWRCSRLASIDGIKGSIISVSLRRQRNLRVTPRMYSFGCWRLFRRFWQIKIISGNIFPFESVLSMISR
ncbi:hypothetical protein HanOQP8_Chr04g0127571 [Helianthus annuus]|nr:hypothetical protein HanHA89_Chr04g0127001 [Helianthus annuus]KAJ0759513.1 hypothetical protein HanOQP8_Chr04g0127571 [Helianthus annuus]